MGNDVSGTNIIGAALLSIIAVLLFAGISYALCLATGTSLQADLYFGAAVYGQVISILVARPIVQTTTLTDVCVSGLAIALTGLALQNAHVLGITGVFLAGVYVMSFANGVGAICFVRSIARR